MLSRVRDASFDIDISNVQATDHTYIFDPIFSERKKSVNGENMIYGMLVIEKSTYVSKSLFHRDSFRLFDRYYQINKKYFGNRNISERNKDAYEVYFLNVAFIKYFLLVVFRRFYESVNVEYKNRKFIVNIEEIRQLDIRGANLKDSDENTPIGYITNNEALNYVNFGWRTCLCDPNSTINDIYDIAIFNIFARPENISSFSTSFEFIPTKKVENLFIFRVSNFFIFMNLWKCNDPFMDLFLYSEKGNNASLIYNDEKLHRLLFDDYDPINKYSDHYKLVYLCHYYIIGNMEVLSSIKYRIKRSKQEGNKLGFNLNEEKNDIPEWAGELIVRLSTYELELLTILTITFAFYYANPEGRERFGSVFFRVSIFKMLADEITDNWRNQENKLFNIIVDWYYNDNKDWDILAKKVGHVSPYGKIQGNYKAINLLVYNLYSYTNYVNRNDTFNDQLRNYNGHTSDIIGSDEEYLSLLDKDQILRTKECQLNLILSLNRGNSFMHNQCISNLLLDSFKKLKYWSIYRKNRCNNEEIMNGITLEKHKEDDKDQGVISVGFLIYDCHTLEDLTYYWSDIPTLQTVGFVNPDYDGKQGSKEIFSYKEISQLIEYLEHDIEPKDKEKYKNFLALLKKNIEYANTDKRELEKIERNINEIGNEVVIEFLSYILCIVLYARFWGVKKDDNDDEYIIPYSKNVISSEELDNDKKFIRDTNVQTFAGKKLEPWLNSLSRNVRDKLIRFLNIKPNVDPPPKYVVDKRRDRSLDILNYTAGPIPEVESVVSCTLKTPPENIKIKEIPKNTLYGRIYHGIYSPVSCYGMNGDLLYDNIKIYNELFFHIEKEDYEVILTEEVKRITGIDIDVIRLDLLQFTHGTNNERAVYLEDNY